MKSRFTSRLVGLTAILLLSSQAAEAQQALEPETTPASGQAEEAAKSEMTEAPQVGTAGYELAENLKDRQVVNAIGNEIGDITHIIIQGDRITHAIISIGGFVGFGGSDIVVPFGALNFGDEQVTMDTVASSDQIKDFMLFEPEKFGLPE